MDKKVTWTNEVYEDLESIAEYISRDSPYYASAFIEEVLDVGKTLNVFPERGRRVPEINDPDIREIFVKEYRLIYRVEEDRITILGFIHGRRDLTSLWDREERGG